MHSKLTLTLALFLLVTLAQAQENVFSKRYIEQVMQRAFQWQQAHPKHALNDWTNGAYYAGVTQAWKATKNKEYEKGLLDMGRKIGWQPGKRWYHADDMTICMSFIELYKANQKTVHMAPTKATLDTAILYADVHTWENPKVQNMVWSTAYERAI